MLSMARDLAVAAGDADTALAAIAELDSYAIDALKLKTESLATILKSTANAARCPDDFRQRRPVGG